MVSGGSEATESAIKLARKYQIDSGNPSKFKVISRWLSYHGITMGSLALSGFPYRRASYVPYIPSTYHIAPAYCYRCWFNKTPADCDLECAQSLENEIMMQGPETVAAFIAEPFSGMSLCAAAPRRDYFRKIREICDKFGVLLIMDEVMTGFGRTGKYFAYEHFETQPDVIALGKGIAGGYFPLGAVAVTAKVGELPPEKVLIAIESARHKAEMLSQQKIIRGAFIALQNVFAISDGLKPYIFPASEEGY